MLLFITTPEKELIHSLLSMHWDAMDPENPECGVSVEDVQRLMRKVSPGTPAQQLADSEALIERLRDDGQDGVADCLEELDQQS